VGKLGKLGHFLGSIVDPRAWLQVLRVVHYYNYAHAAERRKIAMGRGVQFSPNVSIRNGQHISIGDGAHIGERCSLWAGERSGRIEIRDHALFGPEVYITASNYETAPGSYVMDQPRVEEDVVIGRDVWLGRRILGTIPLTAGVMAPGLFLAPRAGPALYVRVRDTVELAAVLERWRSATLPSAGPPPGRSSPAAPGAAARPGSPGGPGATTDRSGASTPG